MMSQLQTDKYTIAWFKLAEFITRGEKEKALGIYRLLSHSLPNHAFSFQLEGDLLLSFKDDKAAIESYRKAAELYESNKKHIEAAVVYETLLCLCPSNIIYSKKLFEIYNFLNIESKILRSACALVDACFSHKQIINIDHLIDFDLLDNHKKFLVYEHIIVKLIQLGNSKKILFEFISRAIELSLSLEGNYLSSLMSKISIDTECLEYAQKGLQESTRFVAR